MTFVQTDISPVTSSLSVTGWRLLLREGRALLRLAAPIAMIALLNMGMSVTDGVMISMFFGTEALAAVAVGSDFYSIVFYFCAGVLGGLAPFYTAAVAQANAEERTRLERIGWMTVGLLASVSVPLVWFAPLWMRVLGLEADLLARGQGYTEAMALTLMPMLGVMLYRTILTAAERPKVFLKITLAMLPLNAIGNYLFMIGPGPFPAWGSTGAGVSSLLVALTSLALLAAIARRAAFGTRPALGAETPFDWHGLTTVLRVGIPIGIATVAEVGIYLGTTMYAARLGTAEVAANTLTLRTAGIAYAIPAALLQASMVRMARAESLREPHGRKAVTASSLGLSLLAGSGLCLLLLSGSDIMASGVFDTSEAGRAATELAVVLLFLLGLIELLGGPGSAAAGLLRGRKDTRAPMLYVLVGYWAIGAPLGIFLCEAGGLGITGLWIGIAAGALAISLMSLARLCNPFEQR